MSVYQTGPSGAPRVGLRSDFASINVGRNFIRVPRRLACRCFTCARTRDIPLVLVLPDSARGTIISNKSPPVDVMSVFLTRARGKEGATFTSGGFVAIRRKNDAHSAPNETRA